MTKSKLYCLSIKPIFIENAVLGLDISIHGDGSDKLDFTYIDDIVEGIIRVLDRPAPPNPDWDSNNLDPATSSAPSTH